MAVQQAQAPEREPQSVPESDRQSDRQTQDLSHASTTEPARARADRPNLTARPVPEGLKLASLTVSGFKSFADRTSFKFDAPISGIVGPNGCGKSNVVDAIK